MKETGMDILPAAARGKKLIIFGAGNFGKMLASELEQYQIDVSYFVDNHPRGGGCSKSAGFSS